MSTQKAIVSRSVTNNGGSVINGGTDFESKPVFTSRRNSSNTDLGVFGSTVVETLGVTLSVDGASFAKLNEILATRVNTSNTNDILLSGASDPVNRRSIHRMQAVRTTLWSTAFRADKFSLYTGKFAAGYPEVSVDDAMVVSGGVYQDKAADPTRAVPGRLVYRTGAKVPNQSNYSAKNGWYLTIRLL